LRTDVDLSRLPWCPQELFLLNELTQPSTLGELLKATGLKETDLKKILGVFERLGIVEIRDDSPGFVASGVPQTGALIKKSEFPVEALVPVVSNAVLDEKLQVARNESSFTSEQFKNLKVRIRDASSEN